MSKTGIIIIVVIVALLAIGGVYYATKGSPTSTATTAVSGTIVTYTDSGFSPGILSVKKGDTVTFKNNASDDMWVASNPHPLHNGYPTTGGCVSSTFDACHNIAPGSSFSFKFDIAGTWGYHNHLNSSEGGTVVVQ